MDTKPTFWFQIFSTFSLVKNVKELLKTKEPPGGETFSCLHGLRFLSIAWIVLVHSWGTLYVSPTIWNLVDVKTVNYKSPWTIYLVINGLTSVDTFFTIGGLLVSYNLLKALKKTEGKLNLPLFYIHRYLRLTPVYAVIIGFAATLLPLLSSGPNWWVNDLAAEYCRKNWWQNLLYINNLIKFGQGDGMCVGHSWYLSVDMQLFIISPLLVYPLWRWEKLGTAFLGLVTLGSIVAPFTITYVDELVPTVITSRQYPGTMLKLYTAPWSRAGPYLVGIWIGYFLFKTSGRKLRVSKLMAVGGWLVSTATAFAIIFGIHNYFDPAYDIPRVGSALYAGLHRFTWGLVIAWVIIACVKKLPGSVWINSFLSWKVFGPLSRLTFCMYLVASFVQWIIHLRMKQPLYYDPYTMVNLYFCNLVMTTFISFILTVTIEMPFISLSKLLLRR